MTSAPMTEDELRPTSMMCCCRNAGRRSRHTWRGIRPMLNGSPPIVPRSRLAQGAVPAGKPDEPFGTPAGPGVFSRL